MAFEITKTFVVKAAPAEVWSFLVDPHKVARCMPGAAITEKLDDRTYSGTMTVKVGPVQASYRGKIVFEQLDPVTRTAAIVATGQEVRGKGGADLRLTSSVAERGQGETEVTAVSRVNVSGILAQMGRGMVEDVGDQMFQIFSQRMRSELEAGAAPVPAAGSSPSPRPSPPAGERGDGATAVSPRVERGDLAPASPSPRPSPPAGERGDLGSAVSPPAGKREDVAPEAFDVGALGAKVAGRAAVRSISAPTPLWLSFLLAAVVVYLLFR